MIGFISKKISTGTEMLPVCQRCSHASLIPRYPISCETSTDIPQVATNHFDLRDISHNHTKPAACAPRNPHAGSGWTAVLQLSAASKCLLSAVLAFRFPLPAFRSACFLLSAAFEVCALDRECDETKHAVARRRVSSKLDASSHRRGAPALSSGPGPTGTSRLRKE